MSGWYLRWQSIDVIVHALPPFYLELGYGGIVLECMLPVRARYVLGGWRRLMHALRKRNIRLRVICMPAVQPGIFN